LTFTDGAAIRAAAAAQVIVDDLEGLSLADDDARHLFRVRRLHDGEEIIATDGAGSWRRCNVDGVGLRPIGEVRVEPLPAHPLTVAFAPVKGDRGEWAVAKLTELGCDRIVALETDHAAIRWSPAAATRVLERWRRIARESCCQSRRVRLPSIDGPLPVSAFTERGCALGAPGGGPLSSGITTVLIGPEGGWSAAERARGLPEIGLAGNVLRTETAAVSAGVLLEGLRAGTVGLVETAGGSR